jgi:hypothetical protein
MHTQSFNAEDIAQQLGAEGVDNLVTNAERVCTYEQQRIELNNQSMIVRLHGEYNLLVAEGQRIEEKLHAAPPSGDLRRLRRRAIYSWSITAFLTVAGFALSLMTLAPFRLGWVGWLYCGGIAIVTPYLVDKLLEVRRMEKLIIGLTAFAAIAALAGLMLLAVIRGNLLAEDIHQNEAPAVVLDDPAPQTEPQNTFYDSTTVLLRAALLLLAFAMELGAGLALRDAWRSVPDSSEDWNRLRGELIGVRQRMCEIASEATMLRNEPEMFVKRFWRDFYYALLSNAARSAMTKLLVLVLGISFLGIGHAHAEDRLNMVIAIDLTQSVAGAGPDGKTDFQKNIDGVTRVLSQVPAGAHVTVIGITDHSFAQPYILLSAHVPEDAGYFGERLNAARAQILRAWKARSAHLDSDFQQTDILGVLQLVGQIFAQQPDAGAKTFVIFSDMRQSTSNLNLESPLIVPPFSAMTKRCGTLPDLHNVEVHILGADGVGKSSAYWESLHVFWTGYFRDSRADLQSYSVLRELPRVIGSR